jgi:hypothetical protein
VERNCKCGVRGRGGAQLQLATPPCCSCSDTQTQNGTTRLQRGVITHRGPANYWPNNQQKNDGPPPTHLLYLPPAYRPNSKGLILSVFKFWAFLGKGSSKSPQKHFTRSPCGKSFTINSTKISLSAFPLFSVYRVFLGALSDRSSKTLPPKKRPKIRNRFFLDFFGRKHVFGRREFENTIRYNKYLALSPFRPLAYLPTTRVPDFYLLCGPL